MISSYCSPSHSSMVALIAHLAQGVPNNYETDLILHIVEKAASLANVSYATADADTKTSLKVCRNGHQLGYNALLECAAVIGHRLRCEGGVEAGLLERFCILPGRWQLHTCCVSSHQRQRNTLQHILHLIRSLATTHAL